MRPLFILICLYLTPCTIYAVMPFEHDLFDQVLHKYVNDDGLVNYAALSTDRDGLDAYVDSLALYSPPSTPGRFPTPAHGLAYWINAYNAFVIRGIVDKYPLASVKDAFLFSGFFNRQKFVAGMRELTLDDIENGIIRPEYRDPRIHFAVNCGALSCPQLYNRAFTGQTLDSMLERGIERFAVNPKHIRLEGGQLTLSKILDWYGKDFSAWFPANRENPDNRPTIVNYLLPYLSPEIASQLLHSSDIDIAYFDYDWALNENKKKGIPSHAAESP